MRTSVAGLSIALTPFPEGSMARERPPVGGWHGCANMRTLPDADRGIPKGGVAPFFGRKLRSGVCRPAGRAATVRQPGTSPGALARRLHIQCGHGVSVHMHPPRLMCTRRSATTLADPRSKSASREPSRAPCREAVDHRSGSRGSVEVVQLDDPLEAGLQVAILFEHPVILLADGLLDSGDLAADPHCRVPEQRRGRML